MKVLVKRFYDDFMDEYHGIFFWMNLIAFPRTEMKMNDQKNSNSGSNESTLISSLVDNYIRIFQFQILSSTYNP